MVEIDNSTEPKRGQFSPLFLWAGMAATGLLLSQCAFSKRVREEILERDGDCVDNDGNCLGGLIASHTNHNKRAKNYDSPENGNTRCHYHEMMYHIDTEGHNGLSRSENMDAIRGNAGMIGLLKQVGNIIAQRRGRRR
jgi:hypothetical protein